MIFVCLFLEIVPVVSSLSPPCVLCRYFLLDPDVGQLHYFVNEQGKSQKPRGSLPLIGASVTPSDEAPHMFVVHSVNGELYKLRGETWRLHGSAACCRGLQRSTAGLGGCLRGTLEDACVFINVHIHSSKIQTIHIIDFSDVFRIFGLRL